MVHDVPAQVNSGKMVLEPIVFPCVLDVAGIHVRQQNKKREDPETYRQ